MEISIDLEADALYISFTEKKFASNKKIDENTLIDLDEEGNLIGIELLSLSKRIPLQTFSDIKLKIPIERH